MFIKTVPRRVVPLVYHRARMIRHYSTEDAKPVPEAVEEKSSQLKSNGRVRSSSRFQQKISIPSAPELEKPSYEFVKSPEVIRKELTEKYGTNLPESFIQEMIEESQNFESNLKKSIKEDGSLDIEVFQADDLKLFIGYVDGVIGRFYDELDELTKGKTTEDDSSFMSRLTSMLTSGKVGEDGVNNTIDNVTEQMADHMKPTAHEDLIALFKAIGGNLKKHNKDLPLEIQSSLFNCAIRLPLGEQQDELLYVAGNLIYLNKGLRADPFNEARYIHTLIKHKSYIQLEYLWNSRRSKDVKGQRFWDEIGILIYIALRNISKLELLAKEILSQYGYILPSSTVELLKLHLLQANSRLLIDWVDVFDAIGNQYGFDQVFKPRVTNVDILDSDDDKQGFMELNKPDTVNFEDVYFVLVLFLNLEQYDIAADFSLKYIRLIPEIENYLLFKFSELPSEIQAGLFYALSNMKSQNFKQKLESVLRISSKSEMELKQLIFKRFLQRKSPLLSSEEFDNILTSEDCYAVIKDLTRRGLHKDVNTLLQYMQDVRIEKNKGSTVTYVVPPVSSVHYIPILQKFGRHKSDEVVERAQRLLLIMNKVGVPRGQYFNTQFLLTLYRKREFQICLEYIKRTFIDTKQYIWSYMLLDTVWVIYRDANRTYRNENGVKLTTEEIYDLVNFTLRCYEVRPPNVAGVSLVIETLLATQNFPLVFIYLQALASYDISLNHDGFLKMHNVLLRTGRGKDLLSDSTDLQMRERLIDLIQQSKISLLTKDKNLQTLFQTYDLKLAYKMIYQFYKLFWDVDSSDLEHKIFKLANDLKVEFKSTEEMIPTIED